jgi:hypothetical protein
MTNYKKHIDIEKENPNYLIIQFPKCVDKILDDVSI